MQIDRSKLIYDLSMQCAAYIVSRDGVGATTVQSAMLDAFASSVEMYKCMVPDSLDEVIDQL